MFILLLGIVNVYVLLGVCACTQCTHDCMCVIVQCTRVCISLNYVEQKPVLLKPTCLFSQSIVVLLFFQNVKKSGRTRPHSKQVGLGYSPPMLEGFVYGRICPENLTLVIRPPL